MEVIENLNTALVAVMKDGQEIGYTARYDRLAPVITSSYDLPFIARTSVGRYWNSFNPDQRKRFVEAFSKLSIATYASNFDSYSGQRFVVASQQDLEGGNILVRTKLIKADKEEVKLDYILRQVAHQWRIINVIADGVSDLALKRSDYTSFLKTHSVDAFIEKLNEKVAQHSR
jgi:phospholipid transport system substrate-binding protein